MAPTAAMLLLSHNEKAHTPSVTMPPSSQSAASYFGLKGSPLKWTAEFNPISKAGSDNNQIQTQTRYVVGPSARENRFEEALQLCSC